MQDQIGLKNVAVLAPQTRHVPEIEKILPIRKQPQEAKNAGRLEKRKKSKVTSQLVVNHSLIVICPHCQREVKVEHLWRHEDKCRREKKAFHDSLSKCTLCNQSFLRYKLAAHMTKSHRMPNGTPGNLPVRVILKQPAAPPTQETRMRCKQCGLGIYPHAMDRHIQRCHSPEAELHDQMNAARRFSFVLLPVAHGNLREAIEGYRKLSRSHPHSLVDASFDWERLESMERLNPIARYVGVKLWKGYVVFEFEHSDRVVLECPRTGNATYILSGDWRKMISATKMELRTEYRKLTIRILHTAGWEDRVHHSVFPSTCSGWQSPAIGAVRR